MLPTLLNKALFGKGDVLGLLLRPHSVTGVTGIMLAAKYAE